MCRFIGDVEPRRHVFQTVAWPSRIQPACHGEPVTSIMWWIGPAQSGQGHSSQAQVTGGLGREKHRVRMAKEVDEASSNVFDGRVSPDRAAGDTVPPLNVLRNGRLGSDKAVEGGHLMAI
jgi:hypothetical protein